MVVQLSHPLWSWEMQLHNLKKEWIKIVRIQAFNSSYPGTAKLNRLEKNIKIMT